MTYTTPACVSTIRVANQSPRRAQITLPDVFLARNKNARRSSTLVGINTATGCASPAGAQAACVTPRLDGLLVSPNGQIALPTSARLHSARCGRGVGTGRAAGLSPGSATKSPTRGNGHLSEVSRTPVAGTILKEMRFHHKRGEVIRVVEPVPPTDDRYRLR